MGPDTFVPLTQLCKKYAAVSQGSSETQVIAMDAEVRLEGLPALTFWKEVLHAVCHDRSKTLLCASRSSLCPAMAHVSRSDDHFGNDAEYAHFVQVLHYVEDVPLQLPPSNGLAQVLALGMTKR